MKEFIELIVKTLVDNPESVRVSEIRGEGTIVYELHVRKGELGKVIGKRGQTAWAIRTLLTAVSRKQGKRAILEILE